MSIRPLIEQVTTPELHADDSRKIEPQYRSALATNLTKARTNADTVGIALAAYALAYSYDHFAPYDFEQSRTLLGESLTYFPEWPEALFNRGVVHIHLKKFQEAIQDFEQAERAFDKADAQVPETAPEKTLIKGKLLLFQAEAFCGRAQLGDFEMARANLIRAEIYLFSILGNVNTKEHARFWIEQIPARLKAIVPAKTDQESRTIHHPVAFLVGLALVPFLIWWMVDATTPKPPSNAINNEASLAQPELPRTPNGGNER